MKKDRITTIKNKLLLLKPEFLRLINGPFRLKYTLEKRNILEVKPQGGLCNKLFCLFAACEIAQKNNFKILEPEFGWREKIPFSAIYDIDFFNRNMSEHFDGKNVMIAKNTVHDKKLEKKIRYDKVERTDFWQYSVRNISHLRTNRIIYSKSMMVNVLRSLKLRKEYDLIVNDNSNHSLSVQFRIESDWVNYSKGIKLEDNETLLIDPNQLIKMLKDFNGDEVFFTTGENHKSVQLLLDSNAIKSSYFYDNNLEYEINAAINFEILTRSQKFIGLSRSTFSNLITLKRHLILNNPENYIYNYGNEITKRVDYGLFSTGQSSVSIIPQIL